MKFLSSNCKHQKQPPEVFFQKGVLKNFPIFTEKHLCHSLFYNKVVGLKPETLLKRILWHRCFSVNLRNFSEHDFFIEHLPWLLLNHILLLILMFSIRHNLISIELDVLIIRLFEIVIHPRIFKAKISKSFDTVDISKSPGLPQAYRQREFSNVSFSKDRFYEVVTTFFVNLQLGFTG